jgi:hypothetical protein
MQQFCMLCESRKSKLTSRSFVSSSGSECCLDNERNTNVSSQEVSPAFPSLDKSRASVSIRDQAGYLRTSCTSRTVFCPSNSDDHHLPSRYHLQIQRFIQVLLLRPLWCPKQLHVVDLTRGLGVGRMARKGQLLRPKRLKIGESFLNAFRENCDVQQTFLQHVPGVNWEQVWQVLESVEPRSFPGCS